MKNEIRDITKLVLRTKGTDISIYEETFLTRSLEKRLVDTNSCSYSSYLEYMKTNESEIEILIDSLHVTFSAFFRNPLTFSTLEQNILPILIEKKKNRQENEIRVWSAACASGQEAYSIAILIEEAIEDLKVNFSSRVFATDISQAALSDALEGVYQTTAMNDVTLKRVQKYFVQKGKDYIIKSRFRDYIDFSVFDLHTNNGDSPPTSIYGNFDLIFCSNVLFYYKPVYQTQIIHKLSKSLACGGYLITSETERDIMKDNNYREVYINSGIFQKADYR